jgi:hypothetical protein
MPCFLISRNRDKQLIPAADVVLTARNYANIGRTADW